MKKIKLERDAGIMQVGDDGTSWSIFIGGMGDFRWWCGKQNGWVSPASDYWQMVRDCWNEEYPTAEAALRAAEEILSRE